MQVHAHPIVVIRAMDGLEEWRKETKEMQRQQEMKVFIEGMVKYPKATDTAPFATETDSHNRISLQQPSDAQARLKVSGTKSIYIVKRVFDSSRLACKHYAVSGDLSTLWGTLFSLVPLVHIIG